MVLDGTDPARTTAAAAGRRELAVFGRDFYQCLTKRADALFELCDAVLCAAGPVTSLPELSLEAVHRRGWGSTYAALSAGRMDVGRLRMSRCGLPLPRSSGGQIRLAVDVTPWPCPDAECSAERLHCHRPCRCDGVRQTIPGWPYSIVVALESGRSSWTAPLDARRVGPEDDLTEVTAGQVREVVDRLHAAGQWAEGDPPILVVMDAGYDVVRLAWLLRDQPVRLLARLRSDRVFYTPVNTRVGGGGVGRPRRHGAAVKLSEPATWPHPDATHAGVHERYGEVGIRAWGRLHQRLTRRGGWEQHPGELPVIDGTLILVRVDRLRRRPGPETGVAVAQPPRHRRPGPGPGLRRVPAPFRRRAHLPVPQAGPGLDQATGAHPGPGRPVDLADPLRLHPAAPGPRPDRRPTPAVGGSTGR